MPPPPHAHTPPPTLHQAAYQALPTGSRRCCQASRGIRVVVVWILELLVVVVWILDHVVVMVWILELLVVWILDLAVACRVR